MTKRTVRRVYVAPDPKALHILACPDTSWGINDALRAWARTVELRTAYLASILTRWDWQYAYGVYGQDYSQEEARQLPTLSWMLADFKDAQEIDGLAGRVWRTDPTGNLGLLLQCLEKLTDLDAACIALAVRHAASVKPLDLAREDWWLISHRTRPSVRQRVVMAD